MASTASLSPYTLAEIVDRFGARPDPGRELSCRFPLRECSGTAQIEGSGPLGPFEIEIIDLSLGGIGFRTAAPVFPGTVLSVALSVPGIPPQTWRCRVTALHAHEGDKRRGGARFEALEIG